MCAGLAGLPKWLCMFGDFIIGYKNCYPGFDLACGAMGGNYNTDTCECTQIKPLEHDEHGCLKHTQHFCDTDKKCLDKAQACTPIGEAPDCKEWSPTDARWVFSPSKCKPCPTGQHRDAAYTCIPDKVLCPIPSECTPGDIACFDGVSKRCVPQGTGCETRGIWSKGGNGCKTSNIVQCSCGKVDLNNPPGTTCQSACPTVFTGDCPAPRVPNKDGILIDDYRKWADCCIRSGGKTSPCNQAGTCTWDTESGLCLSVLERQGWVQGESINAGVAGLPLGSKNICCWKKALAGVN